MAVNQQLDSLEWSSLNFPYNKQLRELSEVPRLVGGTNSYVTPGGKLTKRPGTINIDSNITTTLTSRVDRVWLYETLDSHIYIVASVTSDDVTWQVQYIRLDAGSPAWTSAGSLRALDVSTFPHEAVVSRGLLFIKGFPAAGNSEKLGSVVFDGTGGTVVVRYWGLLGPTVPAYQTGAVNRINESASLGITAAQTTFHLTASTPTNLLLWTQAFSNAVWSPTGLTIVDNAAIAPDGSSTAATITPSGSPNSLTQTTSIVTTGVPYTFSVYLKVLSGTPTFNLIMLDNSTFRASGVITPTNSWQRYSITGTLVTAINPVVELFCASSGWSVAAWGAQLEIGSAPTPYQQYRGPYNLPAASFNLQVDYELMTCTAFNTSTGVATVLRGAQGTLPAAHADKSLVIYRDWATSAHPVTINQFWGYTYAYKTATGQISNRAPLQTNPDLLPSETGPFLNLIPQIVVQGQADTTNIPTIVIYRTTDGGGTFMKVQEITNTGAWNILYKDTSLTSGAGTDDPIPDSQLDSTALAPSLTSNGPPPTVLAPKITGTDAPAHTTRVAYYAGRLWFAIGNVLFFSADEELNAGIPEESFPSGLYGNFFRFQHPVVNVEGTTDALYIVTTQTTYEITGTSLETFNTKPILNNVGGAEGHPRAMTAYGDAVVWLTNDLRIAVLQGKNFKTISEPLLLDYVTQINAGAEIDIHYWAELDREWLVVSALNKNTPAKNKTWVYDITKSVETQQDFWHTPWNLSVSAVASGRVRETQQQRRLLFFYWSGSAGMLSRMTSNSSDLVGTDITNSGAVTFDFKAQTSLLQVPPGDHVNALRRPGMVPVEYAIVVERTIFPGDVDPQVYYYVNDLWTSPQGLTPAQRPARETEPLGYKTLVFPIQKTAKRIALQVDKLGSTDLFEIQNLTFTWTPDAGSGI